jgi:hypothetical protein
MCHTKNIKVKRKKFDEKNRRKRGGGLKVMRFDLGLQVGRVGATLHPNICNVLF